MRAPRPRRWFVSMTHRWTCSTTSVAHRMQAALGPTPITSRTATSSTSPSMLRVCTPTPHPGAPCVAVSASVAVVVDPCGSVLENGADAVQFTWLGQLADGSHVFNIVARDCASARLSVLGSDGRSISDRQVVVVPNAGTTVRMEPGALAAGTYLMRVELCSGVSARTFVHVRRSTTVQNACW